MPDYCKHGLEMTQTCRKCGRIKAGQASDFESRKNGFLSSIDALEEAVRRMQIELAKEPLNSTQPEEPVQEEAEQPQPEPPQRFPWQRG